MSEFDKKYAQDQQEAALNYYLVKEIVKPKLWAKLTGVRNKTGNIPLLKAFEKVLPEIKEGTPKRNALEAKLEQIIIEQKIQPAQPEYAITGEDLSPTNTLDSEILDFDDSGIPIINNQQPKIPVTKQNKSLPKPIVKKPSPLSSEFFAKSASEMVSQPETNKDYKYIGRLGKGGMGLVEEYEDVRTGRRVAIKTILPDKKDKNTLARFFAEAKNNSLLEHPNILPVYEFLPEEQRYVMKKNPGDSLETVLKKITAGDKKYQKQFPLNERVRIMLKVCEAMKYAHNKGIIHRDLKPDNIMMGEHGDVLVVDWGLSKKIGDAEDLSGQDVLNKAKNADLTLDGQVMGTPAFISPEQVRGKLEEIDEQSDIYLLGGTMHNLISLTRPHEGASVNAMLMNVLKGKKTPLPHTLPAELRTIVYKAMELNKKERYQTVDEMIKDIQAYLNNETISGHEYSLMDRIRKYVQNNTTKVVALGAAAAGLALITVGAGTILNIQSNAATAKAKIQAKADREEAEKIKANEKAVLAEKDKAKAEANAANATADAEKEKAKTLEAKAEAATLRAENAEVAAKAEREAREKRDKSNALIQKGYEYSRPGNYTKAIQFITEAITIDPTNAEAYFNRSEFKRKIKDDNPAALEEAIRDAEKAIQIAPENQIYITSYAHVLEEAGKKEDAKKIFLQLIESDKQGKIILDTLTELNVGSFLSRIFEFEKAIEYYDRYAEKMPDDTRIYTRRANAYNNIRKYDLAKADALTALAKKDFRAYYELAFAEYSTGEYDQAEEHFKLAKKYRTDRDREIDFALAELEKLKKK